MAPSSLTHRFGLLASCFILLHFGCAQTALAYASHSQMVSKASQVSLILTLVFAISCLLSSLFQYLKALENDRKVEAELRRFASNP